MNTSDVKNLISECLLESEVYAQQKDILETLARMQVQIEVHSDHHEQLRWLREPDKIEDDEPLNTLRKAPMNVSKYANTRPNLPALPKPSSVPGVNGPATNGRTRGTLDAGMSAAFRATSGNANSDLARAAQNMPSQALEQEIFSEAAVAAARNQWDAFVRRTRQKLAAFKTLPDSLKAFR